MRKHDEMEAALAREQGQAVRARIQGEAGSARKRRATEIRQAEQSRQWDCQREDIHPEHVLEQLASIEASSRKVFGVVLIDIKRFEESGVSLVECPDCGRTWTLSPRGGVVRFKSHDKCKTTTSTTAERWVMRETIWNIVGGENK